MNLMAKTHCLCCPYLQLSSAHGIGLHLHALFQEAGYRGRGDSCQPGSERDIWKISNGNVSSGLDAVSGDPAFWPSSSVSTRHPQISQSPMAATQHVYSQARGETQTSNGPPANQVPFVHQALGPSQPGTFVPQYSQANQAAAAAQQSRCQRGKREHRRSDGGGRRGNPRTYGGQPGRGSNRRNAAVAPPRPPSWADADWHPMKAVASAKVGQATGGTGVFLPGASPAAQVENARSGQPASAREKPRGNNQYMQPQSTGALPEEWVY